MSEITIKIEAHELETAIARLAEALSGKTVPVVATAPVTEVEKATPANPTVVAAAQAATPVNSVPTTPVTTSVTPQIPVSYPSNPVPNAPEKSYTVDDLSRAGATLIDQGKMKQLLDLLGKYGVQAVTQLNPAHYPAFVADMKALGAQL